jgi:DNA-binding response OmpR family regulator
MMHDMRGGASRLPVPPTTPRVLIVDDEPAIRRALELALTRDGFEVVTAASGADAQAVLDARPVDVMLVDLRIPDMRGDVIYHLAAALQPHLASATVFLTGDVTERADSLIAACHCPFIRKPFELSEVIRTVRAMAPRTRSASA